MTIPLIAGARLVDAATRGDTLVIIQQLGSDSWVHHYTAEGPVHTGRFSRRRAHAVVATPRGFLLLVTPLDRAPARQVEVLHLSPRGGAIASASFRAGGGATLSLYQGAESSLLVTSSGQQVSLTAIDGNLIPGTPLILPAWGSHVVLPLNDGFFVSYLRRNQDNTFESRAAVISSTGELLEDVAAEPISAGAFNDGYYLVVRPWGDAAIASGDPRTITTPAVRIESTYYRPARLIDTVVSGDVTLVLYDVYDADTIRAVRLEPDGSPIDEPLPLPRDARVAAVRDGFLIGWHQQNHALLRRLSHREGWTDLSPVQLRVSNEPRSLDVASDGTSLVLIAWTEGATVFWRTLETDGRNVGADRSIPSGNSGVERIVKVERGATGWLLTITNGQQCMFPCPTIPTPLQFFTLDEKGEVSGAVSTVGRDVPEAEAVGLDDGSWIVAADEVGLLHVGTTGHLLGRRELPMAGLPTAMAATEQGWRGAFGGVVIEYEDAFRMRSLEVASAPFEQIAFGWDDLLALSRYDVELSPFPESPAGRLYSGRLSTPDGDLALGVTSIRRTRNVKADVDVENRSAQAAAPILIIDQPWGIRRIRLNVLQPGESTTVTVSLEPVMPILRLHIVAEEVRDIFPEDNTVFIPIEGLPSSLPRRGAAPGQL